MLSEQHLTRSFASEPNMTDVPWDVLPLKEVIKRNESDEAEMADDSTKKSDEAEMADDFGKFKCPPNFNAPYVYCIDDSAESGASPNKSASPNKRARFEAFKNAFKKAKIATARAEYDKLHAEEHEIHEKLLTTLTAYYVANMTARTTGAKAEEGSPDEGDAYKELSKLLQSAKIMAISDPWLLKKLFPNGDVDDAAMLAWLNQFAPGTVVYIPHEIGVDGKTTRYDMVLKFAHMFPHLTFVTDDSENLEELMMQTTRFMICAPVLFVNNPRFMQFFKIRSLHPSVDVGVQGGPEDYNMGKCPELVAILKEMKEMNPESVVFYPSASTNRTASFALLHELLNLSPELVEIMKMYKFMKLAFVPDAFLNWFVAGLIALGFKPKLISEGGIAPFKSPGKGALSLSLHKECAKSGKFPTVDFTKDFLSVTKAVLATASPADLEQIYSSPIMKALNNNNPDDNDSELLPMSIAAMMIMIKALFGINFTTPLHDLSTGVLDTIPDTDTTSSMYDLLMCLAFLLKMPADLFVEIMAMSGTKLGENADEIIKWFLDTYIDLMTSPEE